MNYEQICNTIPKIIYEQVESVTTFYLQSTTIE